MNPSGPTLVGFFVCGKLIVRFGNGLSMGTKKRFN